jgi:hypothetical protein
MGDYCMIQEASPTLLNHPSPAIRLLHRPAFDQKRTPGRLMGYRRSLAMFGGQVLSGPICG